MIIANYTVEQTRSDTSKVVHYMGGNLKDAKKFAIELSLSCHRNCAWIIGANNKPLMKFFKGQRFSPKETV